MAVSVSRQIAAVKKSAEKMDAAAPAEIGTASAGDVVRQGDLYLVCLTEAVQGKSLSERQLAPGTTQGSRHVAEGDCRVLDADKSALSSAIRCLCGAAVPVELIGPVVECRGKTTITHPEHGNRTLPAESSWAVVYQRQFAEEIRRVLD